MIYWLIGITIIGLGAFAFHRRAMQIDVFVRTELLLTSMPQKVVYRLVEDNKKLIEQMHRNGKNYGEISQIIYDKFMDACEKAESENLPVNWETNLKIMAWAKNKIADEL